jgi:D-alanyl-D-alanine dipeptidase
MAFFPPKVGRWQSVDQWAMERGVFMRSKLGIVTDGFQPVGPLKLDGKITSEAWNNCKVLTLRVLFRNRFAEFLDAIEQLGEQRDVEFVVWDAARPLERQLVLYRRGREPEIDKAKQVTWTIASNHLSGAAIDVATRAKTTRGISFSLPKWWVSDCLPLAASFGLESLYLRAGKDQPHIEVPAKEQGDEVRQMQAELKDEFATFRLPK